jgi:leucyl aminopeptidase (aminopeptidase T)
MDMLRKGALTLSVEEYRAMNSMADRVIALTEGAKEITVTTPKGTNLRLSIEGRGFFTDTTISVDKWGNLPTGEIVVGPVENSLEGELVCDLAIGGIGLIKNPVTILCKQGEVVEIEGEDEAVVASVKKALSTDKLASTVGEMALGLNPKARILQEFLEAEKVSGTAHIAFGRNIDYPTGGKNDSTNHMDFLMDKPTVTAVFPDKRQIEIVVDGKNVL